MKVIVASKNRKKIEEIDRILAPLGIRAVHESELGIALPEVDETGASFAENARLKANSAMLASGLAALADDSGLCVDELSGAPGVYSARYAGEKCSDVDNNAKLLKELSGVPEERRSAHFACAICVIFPNKDSLTAEGECHGSIAFSPEGGNGFGYDPLFLYDGTSLAQMSEEEKDKISHRGKALRAIYKKLEEYINADK